MLEFHSAMLIV